MSNEPFPWLGIVFWLGVFGWLGLKTWSRFRRERERQQTLRIFAERGTPLDKEMLEKLYPAMNFQPPGPWKPTPAASARGLAIAGIVCLFIGLGLLVAAQFIARIEPEALFGMSGGAAIVGCLGLGLMTASWALRRMHARDKEQASATGEDIR